MRLNNNYFWYSHMLLCVCMRKRKRKGESGHVLKYCVCVVCSLLAYVDAETRRVRTEQNRWISNINYRQAWLVSPHTRPVLHTQGWQIEADMPGEKTVGPHKASHLWVWWERQREREWERWTEGQNSRGYEWKIKHNRSRFSLKWNKMAQFEHLACRKLAMLR